MLIIVLQAIGFKGLQSSIVIKGTKTKQNFFKLVLKRTKKRKRSMHQTIARSFKNEPTTLSSSANTPVY